MHIGVSKIILTLYLPILIGNRSILRWPASYPTTTNKWNQKHNIYRHGISHDVKQKAYMCLDDLIENATKEREFCFSGMHQIYQCYVVLILTLNIQNTYGNLLRYYMIMRTHPKKYTQ